MCLYTVYKGVRVYNKLIKKMFYLSVNQLEIYLALQLFFKI